MNLQLCFMKVVSLQPNEAEVLILNRKVTGHFHHFSSSEDKPQAGEGFWNCLVRYLDKMFKQDEIAAITFLKGCLNKRKLLMQHLTDYNANIVRLTNPANIAYRRSVWYDI